jgi:hypothetical protein
LAQFFESRIEQIHALRRVSKQAQAPFFQQLVKVRPRAIEGGANIFTQIFVPQPRPEVGIEVLDDHAPIAALHGAGKFLLLLGQREG